MHTRRGQLRRVEQSLDLVIRAVGAASVPVDGGAFGPVHGGHRPEAPPIRIDQVAGEAVLLLRATQWLSPVRRVDELRGRLARLAAADEHLSDHEPGRCPEVAAGWFLGLRRGEVADLDDAELALARALDADDLGLTAELLSLWPALDLPWRAPAALALRVLDEAYETHGFLPGPGYDTAVRDRLPAEQGCHYDVCTSYHATLAYGILCSTLLQHPVHPAPRSASTRHVASAAFPRSGRRWETVYDALEPTKREGLAAFVVTMTRLREPRPVRCHVLAS